MDFNIIHKLSFQSLFNQNSVGQIHLEEQFPRSCEYGTFEFQKLTGIPKVVVKVQNPE